MSFSPANLFVDILFSLVGLAAYLYGKRNGEPRPLLLGIVLMFYGYFIPSLWLSLGVGLALTALIFWPR